MSTNDTRFNRGFFKFVSFDKVVLQKFIDFVQTHNNFIYIGHYAIDQVPPPPWADESDARYCAKRATPSMKEVINYVNEK